MAAFYLDEEEVWKCQTHPSKRRRSGVCPTCLRDRLVTLCPECANTRPCACFPAAAPIDSTTSSSSSSSSSVSRFQFTRGGSLRDGFLGTGEVGRVSSLIESEPAFRKSRSLAIPFLRSRSKYSGDRRFCEEEERKSLPPRVSRRRIGFWSMFRLSKTKKCDRHRDDGLEEDSNRSDVSSVATDDYSRMMRSRSVAVGAGAGDGFSPVAVKRRGWYFPSPMKAFRQSKLHERSPMHRG